MKRQTFSPYVRLGGAVATGGLSLFVLTGPSRFAAAFAIAATVYLGAAFHLMWGANQETMRRRARVMDMGGASIVLLASAASITGFAAVVALLGNVKDATGWERFGPIAIVSWAIAAGWAMAHTAFAIHYAHLYYGAKPEGGLQFPGENAPNYFDFLYFAMVIGCAAQTADVSISSRRMRMTSLAQGIFAFFYNLAILGLAVNVSASLI